MKIYTNDLVKGHSDFKVKCLTFGLYTQVSDSGPLGPLVMLLPSSMMHLDQWCSSAISPELKQSGSFPLTHSSTAITTSLSDRK